MLASNATQRMTASLFGSLILTACATTGTGSGTAGSSMRSSSMSWAEVVERAPNADIITDAEWRQRIRATGLPWRVRDRVSGVEMLLVPPGEFVMGMSPGDTDAMEDERPAHVVRITKPYYLGRTELTQGQWTSVMGYNQSFFQDVNYRIISEQEAPRRVATLMLGGMTREEAERQAGAGTLEETGASQWPLETVTPDELRPYLLKTGLRLPTEAEWEYACRAGIRAQRYGEIDAIAWYAGNANGRTYPVGQKAANALGFHDMIGNVWEWCSDWYSDAYYGDCENGATDPQGPGEGKPAYFRVARGGSWDHVEKNCRASYRQNHYMPDPRVTDFGVRLARDP